MSYLNVALERGFWGLPVQIGLEIIQRSPQRAGVRGLPSVLRRSMCVAVAGWEAPPVECFPGVWLWIQALEHAGETACVMFNGLGCCPFLAGLVLFWFCKVWSHWPEMAWKVKSSSLFGALLHRLVQSSETFSCHLASVPNALADSSNLRDPYLWRCAVF